MRRGLTKIAVFSRLPLPGRTKSRLIPRLGAWGAARLHDRLLRHAIGNAVLSGARAELHGELQTRSTALHRIARKYGVALVRQQGADLGERMHNAIAMGLRSDRSVILVGSDIPPLTEKLLRTAGRLLRSGRDAVLAPAEDGGYALIGLRRASRRVFTGIQWGGDDVYRRTIEKLSQSGLRWQALGPLWDVDRPADLQRLARIRLRRSFSAAPRRVRR